jgi:anti-anti-sigma regulatory factor
MHTSRTDTSTDAVLAVTGVVSAGDTPRLRTQLFDALHNGERDLLLDARSVTAFDDEAFSALVAARSEAKFRQHRLVVLDAADGVLARSLRRTGLIFRFPVYRDSAAAAAAMATDRSAVALRSGAFGEPEPSRIGPERTSGATHGRHRAGELD